MQVDQIEYGTNFALAAKSVGMVITRLFVPLEMVLTSSGPWTVHANTDVRALESAFQEKQQIWIHGSSSPALKTLSRERAVQQCVVSDVVRSDTGYIVLRRPFWRLVFGSILSIIVRFTYFG